MKYNVLTADYLISDIVYNLDDFPASKKEEMRTLLADIFNGDIAAEDATKHTFDQSRVTLSDEADTAEWEEKKQQFDTLQRRMVSATDGVRHTISPGGSALNTTTTMGRMLGGDKFSGTFLGVLGEGALSASIKHSLNNAGTSVVPDVTTLGRDKDGNHPRLSTSYIINDSEVGDKKLVSFAGNTAAYLTPERIQSILDSKAGEEANTLLLPASNYRKFGDKAADMLLSWAQDNDKELWFSLPTSHKNAFQRQEHFQDIIHNQADVVLGNEEEVCYLYGTDTWQEAVAIMQQHFKSRSDENPVAFITTGKDGAVVVTADYVKYIDPVFVSKDAIKSTVGAGDTAFGGFLSGHVLGLSPEKAAHIGMVLAADKVTYATAQLDSPQASIHQRVTETMDNLQALMKTFLSTQPNLSEVATQNELEKG